MSPPHINRVVACVRENSAVPLMIELEEGCCLPITDGTTVTIQFTTTTPGKSV